MQHAHVSRGEVIGLLGGRFDMDAKILKVGEVGKFGNYKKCFGFF